MFHSVKGYTEALSTFLHRKYRINMRRSENSDCPGKYETVRLFGKSVADVLWFVSCNWVPW